jgi:hypothetical protein
MSIKLNRKIVKYKDRKIPHSVAGLGLTTLFEMFFCVVCVRTKRHERGRRPRPATNVWTIHTIF